jgi:Xaa-Pro aminopeptidase
MAREKITYVLNPTADYHMSEYVSDVFKVREFFSGFGGSAGTLLVSKNSAGLWTDGRYFIMAQKQLSGTGITLYRQGEKGVPTIKEYLCNEIKEGETMAFDGRVICAKEAESLSISLQEKNAYICFDFDPTEGIRKESPSLPARVIQILPSELTGQSAKDKIAQLRKVLTEKKADGILLTKLDEIMWLFNIRGCDIPCNPVALSYAYLSQKDAWIFLQKSVVTPKLSEYFADCGVSVKDYMEIFTFMRTLPPATAVMVSLNSCNYSLYQALPSNRIPSQSPIENYKAIKNAVEQRNLEEVYLKDSIAVTKFIYWIKQQCLHETEPNNNQIRTGDKDSQVLTEKAAAEYMDALRRAIPGFLDLSFPTISAYGENAAIIHYETPDDQTTIRRYQNLKFSNDYENREKQGKNLKNQNEYLEKDLENQNKYPGKDLENQNEYLEKDLENQNEYLEKNLENQNEYPKKSYENQNEYPEKDYQNQNDYLERQEMNCDKQTENPDNQEKDFENHHNNIRELDNTLPETIAYTPNTATTLLENETSTQNSSAILQKKGFLLIDSGGQYLGGTTDVTRTIALGALTDRERRDYTLTAAGMLNLSAARFLKGCTGRNLDILARAPLWNAALDYRHGTGHGIGYMLNVHEGPQNIRWRYDPDQIETPLEEGMLVSNEPGIYTEGSHGIRIENVIMVEKGEESEYGQFLQFQTLTYVPLEAEAIDKQYMTTEQIELFHRYQKEVYEKISPFLTKSERDWLKEVTS